MKQRISIFILVLFIAVLVASILLSCDSSPKVVFEDPIKRRKINLSNHFGEQVSIERGTDTINFDFSYDKETKTNCIIRNDLDTVFVGTASRLKGMFLLNRKLSDGKFRIHALEQTDSTVTGLESESAQSFYIEELIRDGKFSNAIIDTTDQYILSSDNKVGEDVFKTVLKNLNPERLMFDNELMKVATQQDSVGQNQQKSALENFKIITGVYPNPVIDVLTIKTSNSIVDYEYHVIDITGRILKVGVLREGGMELDCSHLDQGEYFLVIKKSNESVRFIKN